MVWQVHACPDGLELSQRLYATSPLRSEEQFIGLFCSKMINLEIIDADRQMSIETNKRFEI